MLRRFAIAIASLGLFVGYSGSTASAAGQVTASLNRSLPELRFTGVSLSDAVDFLRDVSGANIYVNWKALEGAGVSKDAQVNLNIRSISLRKALNMLLSEAGGDAQLAWSVDEGVIEITTKDLADENMIVRIYSIEDLLMDIPDFTNAPDFNLQSTSTSGQNSGGGGRGSGGGGGGGGGAGGMGIFSTDSGKDKETIKTKDERAEELMSLIKEIISPDAWTDNGGKASIRYYNGNLIVRAPRSIHDAIGGSTD